MAGARSFAGPAVIAAMVMTAAPAAGADGGQLFASNCAVCHLADGAGTPGLAPPLKGSVWTRLGKKAPVYLSGVMLTGLVGVPLDGQRYGAAMPPWSHLTDAELAAIGSYVLQKINGVKSGLSAPVVKETRQRAPDYATLRTLREGDK